MRRRDDEEREEVRRIYREDKEEALTGQKAGTPSDRIVALIATNKGDEGGCAFYGAGEGDMVKDFSSTNAAAAYVTLVIGSSMVADRSEDAMVEELSELPTNLSLNETGGNSHVSKRENDCDAKYGTICNDEKNYGLEEGERPGYMEEL